jgi:prepilin signal peptidase PulO-like enzyme (type II secretory pathway)
MILLFASGFGILAAGFVALKPANMTVRTAIPFGPFLALGGWMAWCGINLLTLN